MRKLKSHVGVAAVLLFALLGNPRVAIAQKPNLEQRAIDTAKHVSAKSLDPQLPDQPFENWFQAVVGAGANVTWESNDCGEQTGDPKTTPKDPPVCAQASALLDSGENVTVMIAVGSVKRGIAGNPSVFYAGVSTGEGVSKEVRALHELPAAMKDLEL